MPKFIFLIGLILLVVSCGLVNAQESNTSNQLNAVSHETILPSVQLLPIGLTAEQYVSKAEKEHSVGKNQEAINDYNKAITLDSRYAPAYKGLGNVYYEMRHLKEAKQYLLKNIELSKPNPNDYYRFGWLCWELNDLEKAKDYLETARGLDSNNEGIKQLLAIIYKMLIGKYSSSGQLDSAMQIYDKAVKLNVDPKGLGLSFRLLCLKENQLDLSIQCYEKGLVADPANAFDYYKAMGLKYRYSGKRDLAIKNLEKAQQLRPQNTSVKLNLGSLYLEQATSYSYSHQDDKAILYYEKILETKQQNDYTYIVIGDFFEREKKNSQGVEFFKKIQLRCESQGDHACVESAKEQIKRLGAGKGAKMFLGLIFGCIIAYNLLLLKNLYEKRV